MLEKNINLVQNNDLGCMNIKLKWFVSVFFDVKRTRFCLDAALDEMKTGKRKGKDN